MRGPWKQMIFLPILVAAVLAGCEAMDRSPLDVPTAPQPILGGLLGGSKTSDYTLVRDPLLPGLTEALSSSTLIGANGGRITLLGHTLTVPSGAVSQPTLFTLTVLPTGYVEVDLNATVTSLLGVLEVGSQGFRKPVPVTLTYSRATNVKDPSKLIVVRKKSIIGYKDLEPLPSTVDPKNKTVTAELDHFSQYMLAFP